MPESLRPLLARLDAWLRKHRPRFHAGLCPGAVPADLRRLEGEVQVRLPAGLRTLLAWHDGQSEDFVGQFEQDWRLMSSARIAAAKRDLDADAAATGWDAAWVPFLDNDAGDYLCLDTGRRGAPVRAFWLGVEANPVVAPSLTAWLREFVRNVEEGRYVEDPERGTFIRRKASGGR